MNQHTAGEALTVTKMESQAKWQKENTVVITMRLQKSTDSDLLEYLNKGPKQTIIKAALREYIKNHPEA